MQPADAWRELFDALAACDGFPALRRVERRAARLEKEHGLPAGLTPVRVGLVGGATHDYLAAGLRLALLARGLSPDLHVGGFNQFAGDMSDPDGDLARSAPRVVVVVNTPFNIGGWPGLTASLDEVEALVERECEALLAPARAIHGTTGCEVVLNTLHPIPESSVGNLGARLPGDRAAFVRRLNMALGDRAPPFVHLNDVAGMAARRGLDQWFDRRYWYHAKQPMAFDAVPEYLRNTAALVGALLGKTRKCAVLDLDNTLWGGIVGDDGVENLALGEGAADAEAFKDFQRYLKRLKDRGIVLAVASKNEDSVARDAFERHPEMVLSLDDFVAFEANWGPKSESLRRIAAQLDLGLDAFVFVDDNPAERDLVRRELPGVAVPEMPEDPADFAAALEAGRWFEVAGVTAEDRDRTATYKSRAAAAELRESATDMTSYLRSLEMVGVVRPFDEVSLPRIAQLTNKTNQFNLTTRRATLSEMRSMAQDPAWITRSLRLSDRFGDHGLVSVFFAQRGGTSLVIEGWLMSCRVLKRGAEYALFADVLAEAQAAGIEEIIGVYRPTDRNAMVAGLYPELGFEPMDEEDGVQRFRLDVAGASVPEHFIELELELDINVETKDA